MKYNAPFDKPTEPDAPYVDGNPSAGIQGSIVPAASVEYPQREIVGLIQATGVTPSNTDLGQVIKALKHVDVFNTFKRAVNQGSATQWSAVVPALPLTTTPPPTGTAIWFKPNFDSTLTGAVFSLNGGAFYPVTLGDGVPITTGDVLDTAWVLLFFDGANWQVVAGGNRAAGTLPLLQAVAHWYVNGTTGNDTAYDGSSATVSGTKGPFKTVGRAIVETGKYNMNGYDQYIHIADGVYDEVLYLEQTNGRGSVNIVGNLGSPANVTITNSLANQHTIWGINGDYRLGSVRLTSFAPGVGCIAVYGAHLECYSLRFGACAADHIGCAAAGGLFLYGPADHPEMGTQPFVIEAGSTGGCHIRAEVGGSVLTGPLGVNNPVLNIVGAASFGQAFISAHSTGVTRVLYQSITGAASVTGPRWWATSNGVINTEGQAATYYPGSIAGGAFTGGQYV